nr:hypothetical protein Iba_chr14aCG24270 [Ipomoea batatas]
MTSTLNGSILIECILYELEVVQKTKVDVFKHKSFIKYLFDAYGRSSSPKEYRRVFSKERHWLLKHTKEDVSANDSGETSEITGCEKTLFNSSDPISSRNNIPLRESILSVLEACFQLPSTYLHLPQIEFPSQTWCFSLLHPSEPDFAWRLCLEMATMKSCLQSGEAHNTSSSWISALQK